MAALVEFLACVTLSVVLVAICIIVVALCVHVIKSMIESWRD